MPAPRKVSVLQLERLVGYMEENRALASGQCLETPRGKATAKQQWEELAATLNAVKGHHKTAYQWREYWRDVKYRVKKKVEEQDKRGTGGGPPSAEVLPSVEERIFAIIRGRTVLEDDEERIPSDEEVTCASSPPLGAEELCSVAIDPLILGAPFSRLSTSQPSTSRAPPVEEPPSAAGSAASNRKRRGIGTAADPDDIPQPRWAWEAEQNRLAIDQRRLEVEERSLALFERTVSLFERSVEAQESTASTLLDIYDSFIGMREDLATALRR